MSYKDTIRQQREFQKTRDKKKKKTYYGDGSYTEKDFQNFLNNRKVGVTYDNYVNHDMRSEALNRMSNNKPFISMSQEEYDNKFGGQKLSTPSFDATPLAEDEYYEMSDFSKDVAKSKKRSEKRAETARNLAEKHPMIGAGVAIASDMVSSLAPVQAAYDTVTGRQTNPYKGMFAFADFSEGARQGIKDGTNIPDDVVDLGLSMGSSATRALTMPTLAGMAFAGGSAATSGFRDASERGASDLKAKGYGLLQGAIEAATEKYSIERIKGMQNEPVRGAKSFFKNLARQMATEGSEEAASEILSNISDAVIMKEASHYNLYKNSMLAQGYSQDEAEAKAFKEIMNNIGKAALGGAISGGVLGGSVMSVNTMLLNLEGKKSTLGTDTSYREFAETVDVEPTTYTDTEGNVNTEALEKAEKVKALAEELAAKEESGQKINNLEKGELELATNDLIYTAMGSEEDYYSNIAENNTEETSEAKIVEDMVEEGPQPIAENNFAETAYDGPINETFEEFNNGFAPINEGFAPVSLESSPVTLESLAEETVEPIEPITMPYVNTAMPYATNIKETVETFGSKMPIEATEIMTEMYDGSVDMGKYIQAFKHVYSAGRNNVTLTATQNSNVVANLTDEQIRAAYKAGAQDRNAQKTREIKKSDKKRRSGGLGKASDKATDAQKRVAAAVGYRTGLIINIDDTVGQAEYNPQKGSVTISPYSKNFNQSLAHELTHFLQDNAPKEYRKFKDTVISALMTAKNYDYDSAYALYEAAYESVGVEDIEGITDEMVSDAAGMFLNDEAFINKIANSDRSLAEKIRDFFMDIVDALKELISTEKLTNEAKALKENKAKYQMALNLWNNALAEASENYQYAEEDGDIRYQLDLDMDTTTDTEALVRANRELQETEQYLTAQLSSKSNYMPNRQDINKIAKRLVDETSSWLKPKDVADKLYTFYSYMHNNDYVDGSKVSAIAKDIAGDLLAYSKNEGDNIRMEMFNDLKSYLQKTDIKMPTSEFESEFASKGGFNEFRKKYFGILKMKKGKGTPVDVAYTELSDKFPDMFPSDIINPADQLIHIGETIDMLRPVGKLNEEFDAISFDEASYLLGQEIIDAYIDVRHIAGKDNTPLGKRAKALNDYKKKFRTQYTEEITKLTKENKALNKALAKQEKENVKTKDYYWERVDKLEQKQKDLKDKHKLEKQAMMNVHKQRMQKLRDSNKAAQYKATIKKDIKDLSNWLLKPNDKKHVPESLRVPLAEFLSSVEFMGSKTRPDGSESNTWREWERLKDVYERIIKNDGKIQDNKSEYYLEVDNDIVSNMKALKESIEKMGSFTEFSVDQYARLNEIVKAIKKSVTDANTMFANRRYEGLAKLGEATISDLSKLDNKSTTGVGVIDAADRLINNSMLDSYTRFETFGDAALSVYDELREGLNQKIRYTHEAQEYFENLMEKNGITQETLREWSGEGAKLIKVELESGETVEMKPSQAMSLYELLKRNQAHKHIFVGGIMVGETKTKGKVLPKVIKSNEAIKVTERDALKIIDELSEEQKALADGIQEFFEKYTTKWGNKTSMQLYGYEKFKAKNYFPIKTSDMYNQSKDSDLSKTAEILRNLGMTKDTDPKASNPLVLEDIFDVFTRQVDQMGSYGSFVVPLSDLQKWKNYKQPEFKNSIKGSISAKFGDEALTYLDDLARDINGVKENNAMDNPLDMMSLFKSSAVGLNLKVAVQQPTAYFRALDVMDKKYLFEAATKHAPKGLWETIKKYSPIAQWKDWGYFETNVGKSMKHIVLGTDSKFEKLRENQMWLAGKADQLTWERLWLAAELEIKDTTDLEEGTEAFYKTVGKRFDEIIDATQVIDSVLHRSNIMKRRDMHTKMATAFMSEPIKAFNMVYRAANNLVRAKTPEAKAKARNLTARALVAYTTAQTVNSLINALMRAMRDDDKEKAFDEKYIEKFKDEMIDSFNPLKMIPYIKDVISMIEGFSVKRNDVAGYEELFYLIKDASKDIEKLRNGEELEETPYGIMRKYLGPISSFTGIGIDNLERDVRGIILTALDLTDADEMLYGAEKLEKNIKSEKNLTSYMKMAFSAYLEGDDKLGNKIIRDLKRAGVSEEKIDAKQKSLLKDKKYKGIKGNAKMQYYSELEKVREDGKLTDREVRDITLDMMRGKMSANEAYDLYRDRKKNDEKLDKWMSYGNGFDDYLENKNAIEDIREKYSGSENRVERQEAIVDYIDDLNLNEKSQQLLWEIAGYKVSENSYYKYFD